MHQNQDKRTTAEVYRATGYHHLYDVLLKYRNANALERQGILCLAIKKLQDLQPNVEEDDNLALQQFTTLAEVATLIRYAQNIQKLETHQWIDILFDFKEMSLDPDPSQGITVDLREWFEMHPSAPKIKFLKNIEHYSGAKATEVWCSFEAARARHVACHGRPEFRSNYVRITDFKLRNDGLFPGVFSWMGHYHNEATDRVFLNSQGKVLNMVTGFGELFLSAGGMRNPNDEILRKAIAETIEEHYAQIHLAVMQDSSGKKYLYNQIPHAQFVETIQTIFKENEALITDSDLKALFLTCCDTEKPNSILEKLVPLIDKIDALCKTSPQTADLLSLKAKILFHLFMHTPLYPEIVEYLQTDMNTSRVPQLLDMRAGSGSQISTLVLTKPIENFIHSRIENAEVIFRLGDDVAHAIKKPMTLMQALLNCTKMKFSHLLLILEAYKYATERGDLHPGKFWDVRGFGDTRTEMISELKKYLLEPKYLSAQGSAILHNLLMQTKLSAKNCMEINQKFQKLIANIHERNSNPKHEIAAFNHSVASIIKSKKMMDIINAILIVVLAGVLVSAGGFGIGLAVGVWASPNAFLALLTGNPIVLALCASMTFCVMAGVGYNQFSLFAKNDKLCGDIQAVGSALEKEIQNYQMYYR